MEAATIFEIASLRFFFQPTIPVVRKYITIL